VSRARDLVDAIADLQENQALDIVMSRLSTGEDPLVIIDDTRQATEIIGKRFADGEYYIPELVYSGEILKEITDLVKPRLARADAKNLGKIVLGTVAGDIHNIGKDIVAFMLGANGFEVFDLGVDVPAEKFIQKIKETGAPIVGLSGLLTVAYESMKQTIEAISAAGLKDQVKIMIGGGLMNDDVRKFTGADAYGKDALDGINLAKKWAGGSQNG
jgi:methanogenic corrinoid protein MtbC1